MLHDGGLRSRHSGHSRRASARMHFQLACSARGRAALADAGAARPGYRATAGERGSASRHRTPARPPAASARIGPPPQCRPPAAPAACPGAAASTGGPCTAEAREEPISTMADRENQTSHAGVWTIRPAASSCKASKAMKHGQDAAPGAHAPLLSSCPGGTCRQGSCQLLGTNPWALLRALLPLARGAHRMRAAAA